MLNSLSYEGFKEIAEHQPRVIVFKEISSDFMTPLSAFNVLCEGEQEAILLESGERDSTIGRYSLIGVDPYQVFESSFKDLGGSQECSCQEQSKKNPFDALKSLLQSQAHHAPEGTPAFLGGVMGFLSYDCIRYLENIPDAHENFLEIPDLYFQFPSIMLFFDHLKGTVTFALNVEVSQDMLKDYKNALKKIDELILQIGQKTKDEKSYLPSDNAIFCDTEDALFCQKVKQAKEHIIQGDAFQIVLSRTFHTKINVPPIEIYKSLKICSPAPYMFLVQTKKYALVGASPERLVSLKQGRLETMPIAGTRLRPSDASHEQGIEKELMEDEKENAEHMMLVDLSRNDLGRISQPGSVRVKRLKEIKRFSHVIHLVSVVDGVAQKNVDEIEALKALFPAGTLTGAPKIKAMEIIDRLENSRRGAYGGAICVMDGRGNLESCIAIRMALLKHGTAYVRAGAGVVFDSVPEKEAEETRSKAKGILDAISHAKAGIL